MDSTQVMVPVNSSLDFYENLDALMSKLLDQFPKLTE
jgi:hypothetical protein